MSAGPTTGLTLDTGALLALDHPAKTVAMQARLEAARRRGGTICIPAEAVAQAWRSPRQARLARLLESPDIDIAVMTLSVARSVGLMCADANHHVPGRTRRPRPAGIRPSSPSTAATSPASTPRSRESSSSPCSLAQARGAARRAGRSAGQFRIVATAQHGRIVPARGQPTPWGSITRSPLARSWTVLAPEIIPG